MFRYFCKGYGREGMGMEGKGRGKGKGKREGKREGEKGRDQLAADSALRNLVPLTAIGNHMRPAFFECCHNVSAAEKKSDLVLGREREARVFFGARISLE